MYYQNFLWGKNYKYFMGYLCDNKIKPLHIMLIKKKRICKKL